MINKSYQLMLALMLTSLAGGAHSSVSAQIDTPTELLISWKPSAIDLGTARWLGQQNFYDPDRFAYVSSNWNVSADVWVESWFSSSIPEFWQYENLERDAFGSLSAQHLSSGGTATARYLPGVDGTWDGNVDDPNAVVNIKRVELIHGNEKDIIDFSRIRTSAWSGVDGYYSPVYSFAIHATHGISPVPEPETYVMLLAGLGVVGWAVRRQR